MTGEAPAQLNSCLQCCGAKTPEKHSGFRLHDDGTAEWTCKGASIKATWVNLPCSCDEEGPMGEP